MNCVCAHRGPGLAIACGGRGEYDLACSCACHLPLSFQSSSRGTMRYGDATIDVKIVQHLALAFVVPGPPVPKERPRVVMKPGQRANGITASRTRTYEEHVGMCALAARQKLFARWPLDAKSYSIVFRIFESPSQRGDFDNYAKSLADGMQGILYGSDRRIRRATIEVDVSRDRPRAEVEIEAHEA